MNRDRRLLIPGLEGFAETTESILRQLRLCTPFAHQLLSSQSVNRACVEAIKQQLLDEIHKWVAINEGSSAFHKPARPYSSHPPSSFYSSQYAISPYRPIEAAAAATASAAAAATRLPAASAAAAQSTVVASPHPIPPSTSSSASTGQTRQYGTSLTPGKVHRKVDCQSQERQARKKARTVETVQHSHVQPTAPSSTTTTTSAKKERPTEKAYKWSSVQPIPTAPSSTTTTTTSAKKETPTEKAYTSSPAARTSSEPSSTPTFGEEEVGLPKADHVDDKAMGHKASDDKSDVDDVIIVSDELSLSSSSTSVPTRRKRPRPADPPTKNGSPCAVVQHPHLSTHTQIILPEFNRDFLARAIAYIDEPLSQWNAEFKDSVPEATHGWASLPLNPLLCALWLGKDHSNDTAMMHGRLFAHFFLEGGVQRNKDCDALREKVTRSIQALVTRRLSPAEPHFSVLCNFCRSIFGRMIVMATRDPMTRVYTLYQLDGTTVNTVFSGARSILAARRIYETGDEWVKMV